jgi:RNA polymerase sigma-70 factor (ECF subfamily)
LVARPLTVVENENSGGGSSSAVPSFQAVYDQYFAFVWSSARHLGVDAGAMDDVVQETFIVIYARLHTLKQPEALRSWIYGVVRRTVSDHRRSKRVRDVNASEAPSGELESNQPTPAEVVEKNSELELLGYLLAQLDEPKREVFTLVEIEEMTVPEAAEALELPLNTAYSRLRAARQAFEAALARHEARGGRR